MERAHLVTCIICYLLVTWQAIENGVRIKKHKPIDHWAEGLKYLGAIIVVAIPLMIFLKVEWYLWLGAGLFTRAAWFDIILNTFRGKSVAYQIYTSPVRYTSWWDKLENKLFGKVEGLMFLRVFYMLLFFVYIKLPEPWIHRFYQWVSNFFT